ncbi:Mre11 DNA-binding presumed domain-containing protein [Sphaerosporella brunnea]|uniref:Double-strand break repair protein n=1 Tax=Sphaerosporella brunnea TaxID=1250544 RepID=A0A5J5EDB6_9PEZI|nr:Mre11 DNA-binding presumed domain-containing protein [Sphaerosporella brunnea]
MPSAADTIRILIATDSHVGYNERDPIRGDDSWKSFDEVMRIAKDRDVDMVLLSGDLFHDNKPSRKAMYHAMKSLRENCYGDKPCELEILSDTTEEFKLAGGHVNYEDPDINVAIPVFSIHGNHDDPSGEGRFCALDILSIAGLVNYYGRTPQNDNIVISPVLLQKGSTKLALYGLSNVRDERLFRTFRDGNVKFLRPDEYQKEWFNLICVHQNHVGHTETGYLPENFLQDFLDLVIWGHEHECKITPRKNEEMGFSVIQPGSSVATSLCVGEAEPKHCGILSITGREFKLEKIRLKTVRPFVMKEIILAEEKEMKNVWKKPNNRTQVTQFLCETVEELIVEAKADWVEAQGEDADVSIDDAPLPLIRLRVEYSAPEGAFETENPQRFSNRFVGKVANVNDIIQFHRKKSYARRPKADVVTIERSALLEEYEGNIDAIKVESLVKEFLEKATLEILPSNGLGDAVGQFVDKDDRHAVETFVEESLKSYLAKMREFDELNEEKITQVVSMQKSYLEDMFAKGQVKIKRKNRKIKEKPDHWDSDIDGAWEDQPATIIRSDEEEPVVSEEEGSVTRAPATRGRGRGRGRATKSTTTTTRKAAAPKKPAAKTTTTGRGRGKKKVPSESEEEDAMIVDDDDEEEPPPPPTRTTRRAPARKAVAPPPASRQMQLQFAPSQASRRATDSQASNALFHRNVVTIPSDDEDIEDDDEDEFAPMASQRGSRRR